MSDFDKVFTYANQLGATKPIQLRWEGAGDCAHAGKLLAKLKTWKYRGTHTPIRYHAVLNLYESNTTDIFDTAWSLMKSIHTPSNKNQTWEMWTNVDVTRASHSIAQSQAHIMFVRNIMPTDGSSSSKTTESDLLQDIHKSTVRQRANSLTGGGGQLRIGMSGAPGLISADNDTRRSTTVENLFEGADELVDEGTDVGLEVSGLNGLASEDFDQSVDIMKNDGSSLGKKPTYYMTFVRRTRD